MKFHKCLFCDKLKLSPFQITEINEGKVETHYMCKECGNKYMDEIFDKPQVDKVEKIDKIDITHIKTPDELLDFIVNGPRVVPEKPPCECGMTIESFNKDGRFGCAKCYDHFHEKMEELVYPYHNARQHVGKYPKRQMEEKWQSTPEEKMKLLKLRFAKALELEEYEKAGVLHKEIEDLKSSHPSIFEDL